MKYTSTILFLFLSITYAGTIFSQPYEKDLAVTAIISPESAGGLGDFEIVVAEVFNAGTQTQANYSLTLTLDGELLSEETILEPLQPNQTYNYTFFMPVDLSNPGQTYEIEVCSWLAGDVFPDNNCFTKDVTHLLDAYCIPSADCAFGDGLADFALGDIQNLESGCSPDGYGDFTSLSTDLDVTTSHTVMVKSGFGSQKFSLFIDLNQDYVFQDDERLITDFEMAVAEETYNVDFNLPPDALSGNTRMRAKVTWIQSSADPCTNASFGEIEDYTVNILSEPLAANVGVLNFELPASIAIGPYAAEATVVNYGFESQSFPVTLTIGDFVSTVDVIELAPGESLDISFDPWDASVGAYSAEVCTQLTGDENPANDCKSASTAVVSPMTAYGYVNYSPSSGLQEGWVIFDLVDPGTINQLSISSLDLPLIGATWVDGMIYAVAYEGEVYSFDPISTETTLLFEDSPLVGIAFDGTNFYGNSYAELFEINIATGELSLIGSFEDPELNGITSIAFDGNGNLYGVDLTDDNLFSIDKATADVNYIGPLGGDFIIIQDIAFDKTTNTLYFAGQNYSGESGLYIINTQTGEAVMTAPLQNNVHISAFTIPSENTLLLPPSNLQATVNGNNVELSWQEPFTGSYTGFNVYRDGNLLGSVTTTTFSDSDLDFGIYQYQVSAFYDEGESQLTDPLEVAIGNPDLAVNPVSIDQVVETGESVLTELVIHNTGNINLNYSLNTAYTNQNKSQNKGISTVTKKQFEKLAAERFGEGWQQLLYDPSDPESINDYCIPTSNCNFGDGINSFELAEISNVNSGCSPNGFGDFTNLSTGLATGTVYDVTISSSYSNNFVNVWIDLNQDEEFTEDERVVSDLQCEIPGQTYTAQLEIPVSAINGETRMRVMGSWLYSNTDPCQNTNFGETEDYTVIIGASNPWIALDPLSGSIAPGDNAVVQVTLDASNLPVADYTASILVSSNDTINSLFELPVNLTVIDQSLSNFDPVWETPFNPMTIFVVSAQIDSLDMQLGDEVGVFDIDPNTGQEICVGAGLVTQPINNTNILEIIVSMDDGSNPDVANGFTPGNELIFKLWTAELGEISEVITEFPTPGFDEVFTPLGTAIVALSAEVMATQQMVFQPGWNLVSSSVVPLNTNMMSVFQPLIEDENLLKVIDQDGGSLVYLPLPDPEGKWVNSIGEMSIMEGYYVKVSETADVSMQGMPLAMPVTVPLQSGWNIMGYPADDPQDALETVQPLIDGEVLYKVLDDAGGLIQYIPFPEPNGQWINTIGNLQNGKGYYIKVLDESSLMIGEGQGGSNSKSVIAVNDPVYFEPVYQNNPYMPMHFILMTNTMLNTGDEVGIFDGEVCVGASVYDGNSNAMSITVTSMDDPATSEMDGFTIGNDFTIKVYSNGQLYESVQTEYIDGSETFAALETYVGNITDVMTGSNENAAGIQNFLKVAPNPASGSTSITLKLTSEAKVAFTMHQLTGEVVSEINFGTILKGTFNTKLDVSDLNPGVYVLKVHVDGQTKEIFYQKVIVQ
ncbi:MAG: T9SS type A sorting domain-containing protein [Bacteroidetes bacterium]|nr:T9SS type A sorting domain-containing protein [Bacteroidota bacterium]